MQTNIYIQRYAAQYLKLNSATPVDRSHKLQALANLCKFFGLELIASRFFGVKIVDSNNRYLKLSMNTINLLFKFADDCNIKINIEKNYSEECAIQNKNAFKTLYNALCEDLDLPANHEQCLELGDAFLFLISHRDRHLFNNYPKCISIFLDFIKNTLDFSLKLKNILRKIDWENVYKSILLCNYNGNIDKDIYGLLINKNNFYPDILLKELVNIYGFFFSEEILKLPSQWNSTVN